MNKRTDQRTLADIQVNDIANPSHSNLESINVDPTTVPTTTAPKMETTSDGISNEVEGILLPPVAPIAINQTAPPPTIPPPFFDTSTPRAHVKQPSKADTEYSWCGD